MANFAHLKPVTEKEIIALWENNSEKFLELLNQINDEVFEGKGTVKRVDTGSPIPGVFEGFYSTNLRIYPRTPMVLIT
jgi:hypothetical protein